MRGTFPCGVRVWRHLTDGLDALERKQIFCPCRESCGGGGASTVQAVAWSVSWPPVLLQFSFTKWIWTQSCSHHGTSQVISYRTDFQSKFISVEPSYYEVYSSHSLWRNNSKRIDTSSNWASFHITHVSFFIRYGRQSQWPLGLRCGYLVVCGDWGFESFRGHEYLSLMSVVCCQVNVSGSGWSLVQRSRAECGVFECDRKATIMRGPWPTGGSCAIKKSRHCISWTVRNVVN
jgi:hypothetical protein